jgi:hypothetical protein
MYDPGWTPSEVRLICVLKNKSEYAYKKLYRFDYKNNLNEYLKIILKYL